jgi:hypothetical protein
MVWGVDWQAKPSQAKPSQAKPRQAKPSQGKPSQAKPRQGKARQGKARQGKARQGKARQAKAGHEGDNGGGDSGGGDTHTHTYTHTYTQCMMPELGVGPGSEIPGGVKYKDIRKVYPKEEKGDCGARFLLALEKAFHDLGHEDLLRVVQQGHGDVVRVPVGWYHMVLNHHPKLAIAIECLPLDTLEVVADNYLNAARQFGPYGAEDYVGLASQLWSMLEPIFEAAADEEPGALPLQQAKDVDAAMEGAKKKVEQGGEKQRKRNRVDQGGEE